MTQIDPLERRVLLGEQTASMILKNVVYVYFHHFGVVVGTVVVAFGLPVMLIAFGLIPGQPPLLSALTSIAGVISLYVALFVIPSAMTVVASDICLGNKPKLSRAFGRVLGQYRWWHLITTALLVSLAFNLGLIMLCLPGLWVWMRTTFAMPIAVLEGRRNRDAIRRSFELTKGQVWRLSGLIFLPGLLPGLVLALFYSAVLAFGALGDSDEVVTLLLLLLFFCGSINRHLDADRHRDLGVALL